MIIQKLKLWWRQLKLPWVYRTWDRHAWRYTNSQDRVDFYHFLLAKVGLAEDVQGNIVLKP